MKAPDSIVMKVRVKLRLFPWELILLIIMIGVLLASPVTDFIHRDQIRDTTKAVAILADRLEDLEQQVKNGYRCEPKDGTEGDMTCLPIEKEDEDGSVG